MSEPVISLMHITARVPYGWENACRIWRLKAADPNKIEYVLSIHSRQDQLPNYDPAWPFDRIQTECRLRLAEIWGSAGRLVVNYGRPSIVDNSNTASQATRGLLVVPVTDDLMPSDGWDLRLLSTFWSCSQWWIHQADRAPAERRRVRPAIGEPWVIRVSHDEPEFTGRYPSIITHGIVTQAYLRQLGYSAWPEYVDYGCDDDFSLQAYGAGVVVDRTDIVFPHLTWQKGRRQRDLIDAHNGRPESWETKERVLGRRIKEGFPTGWPAGVPRPWVKSDYE